MSIESIVTIAAVAIVPAVAYLVSMGVFTRQNTDAIKGLQAEIATVRTEMKADMKEEISRVETGLKAEISRVETELKAEISRVETELKAEISRVETELKAEVADMRNQMREDHDTLVRVDTNVDLWLRQRSPRRVTRPEHASEPVRRTRRPA